MSIESTIFGLRDLYHLLPRITKMDKIFHFDYWDYPINGLCKVDNQKCWFQLIEEWDEVQPTPEERKNRNLPYYRHFLIWKLSEEQISCVEDAHAKFREMVGYHTSYDARGVRCKEMSPTATKETAALYYEQLQHETGINVAPANGSMIIGWYEVK